MVAPNITAFNMTGLAPSTGTSAGTILEFDSAGNILPMAGTYKTVSAINTAIASIDAPYAMSWAANSEYTYYGNSSVQPLAIWDTLNFGNSSNMATKTTWTCPAACLWHIAAMFGFYMNTNDVPCSFWLYHNGGGGMVLYCLVQHCRSRQRHHHTVQVYIPEPCRWQHL